MKRTGSNQPGRSVAPRRGAFLIVVMVCLLVAGLLLASMLKLALLQDRQLGYEQARLQAAWLADSGLERAASRLALEPGYIGESWTISAAQLGGPDAAVVVIRVHEKGNRESRRTIDVEATFPAQGTHQARLTRQATITVSKES